VPSVKLLKEYVSNNFINSHVSKVHVDRKTELGKWAGNQKDLLLIAGSYSRTNIVDKVIDSFIDAILEMKQFPVYPTKMPVPASAYPMSVRC
jgi:hypothetical protein